MLYFPLEHFLLLSISSECNYNRLWIVMNLERPSVEYGNLQTFLCSGVHRILCEWSLKQWALIIQTF